MSSVRRTTGSRSRARRCGRSRSSRLVVACAALLDVAVYGALTRNGLTPAKAAEEVSGFILARLAAEASRAESR